MFKLDPGPVRRGKRERVERRHTVVGPNPLPCAQMPPDVRAVKLLAAERESDCNHERQQGGVSKPSGAVRGRGVR
jgi:hypothetical protein